MKEGAKQIARNFLNLNLINVLGIVIPILAMPKLSAALGQDGYALVLLASVIFQFGVLVTDYSFNLGAARDVARLPSGTGLANYYGAVQSARYLLLVIYSALAIVYLTFANTGLSPADYVLYIATGVVGHIWFASWFHLGRSRLSEISYLLLASRFSYLAVILLWVDDSRDVDVALAANSAPLLAFGAVGLLRRFRCYSIRPRRFAPTDVEPIRKGFSLFVADFSPNLYNNFPALYLAHSLDKPDFAVYAVALRLINAATSVQVMLGRAMLPVLSAHKEIRLSRVFLVNLLLSACMCIGLWVASDWIVRVLVGPGYTQTADYLDVLALSLVFGAVVTALSSGYYVPRELDSELRNVSLAMSLTALGVGVPLLLLYGAWGGVALLVLARLFMAAGMSAKQRFATTRRQA